MKTKLYCRRCGEQLIADGGYCFCCHENKGDADVEKRYFPDDPKNAVFAVDAYVTVCKCIKVEAKDKRAAEEAARKIVDAAMNGCAGYESCSKLAEMGFEECGENNYYCNGEADEDGEINYY